MPANYLTLSRQVLYDLVWSKPMTHVAAEFGISDVALAKRCAAVDVPVPPRGWWAKVQAGQTPPRTPLPPLRHRPEFDADAPEPPVILPRRAPIAPRVVRKASGPAPPAPPTALDALLPAVKRAARHYRHPERAGLSFEPGDNRGPFPRLDVSPALLDRGLQFADRLLRGFASRGWTLDSAPPPPVSEADPLAGRYGRPPAPPPPPPPPPYARVCIGSDVLEFRLEERTKTVELPPTPKDVARQARDRSFVPQVRTETERTGQLRFVRERSSYGLSRRSWIDRGDRRIEEKLDDILADFAVTADGERQRREAHEAQQRAWAEAARLHRERQARVEANAELVAELERQAGAWAYARRLRAYLRAARRTFGAEGPEVTLGDATVDFLAWADAYVEEIDPLSDRPHHPDRWPQRHSWHRTSDEDVRIALARWLNLARPIKWRAPSGDP